MTVPAGVNLHVRINESINAKTVNVGDPFTGVLSAPLRTKSGETLFAKGTNERETVVAAKGQGRFAGSCVLAIELSTVDGRSATVVEYVVSRKGKRTAALIGGVAGAGLTGNKLRMIPAESIVEFELSPPLSKTVER